MLHSRNEHGRHRDERNSTDHESRFWPRSRRDIGWIRDVDGGCRGMGRSASAHGSLDANGLSNRGAALCGCDRVQLDEIDAERLDLPAFRDGEAKAASG